MSSWRNSCSGIVASGSPGTGRVSNTNGAGSQVSSANALSAMVSAVSAVLVRVVVAMVMSPSNESASRGAKA
ncbi:hypothetical protein [Micromonospora globbae]|jgi:hypothetical protein|uniref:hypothetical protein n=1 Tax=Micromonospora globbae TaxID=1894969 RepID=UPI00341AAB69